MKVDLLLNLPDSKASIIIQGAVVRWSGSQGIGIEFPSLASPHQELLEGVIQRIEARIPHGKHLAPISGRA
jgi:hypothetical protein